ncbi:signal recognition particle GTPase [Cenarchaeum symbiosum A]|uniref:Signal recognition particle receptor FtsY n=1 Tax=Cenarchaeum symbiosum (strain A) TaxID=414004 RepID=A0RUF0_CENSY|nr:signal recognition particle GTPase [Cenarchaeum symbiosum A]
MLDELEISLLESDVAAEVADSIKEDLKGRLVGTSVDKHVIGEHVRESLIGIISDLFDGAGAVDLLERIRAKKDDPYIIVFVGINGTGKTTSVAKIAHMLRDSKLSVVLAAADTFRAGAIEQLREHAKRLNLKIVAQNYGSDPAAVARDAVLYARSHGVDCVLVDTAGRMQTSKNLMEQIEKIIRVVQPDLKIFVGDSLAGNDTVNQAGEFHEHIKFDCSILTKNDADARGGAALSIVKTTSTPVIYVGTGQEYGDIRPFSKETFIETVFGSEGVQGTEAAKSGGAPPAGEIPETVRETEVAVVNSGSSVEEEEMEANKRREQKTDAQAAKEREQEEMEANKRREQEQAAEQSPHDGKEHPKGGDPFDGIDTKDIEAYLELHDTPPPETDDEAERAASKIKSWISEGRQGKEAKGSWKGRFRR